MTVEHPDGLEHAEVGPDALLAASSRKARAEVATIRMRGTFPLRGHIVVYGDILDGTIRNGDLLHLPVRDGRTRHVPINSVEAVDGTPTGSHVALVLAAGDHDTGELGESLKMVGSLLNVSSAEGDAGVAVSNAEAYGKLSFNEGDFAGWDQLGRRVYLAYCDRFQSIVKLQLPGRPFVLFVGGDTTPLNVDQIFEFAQHVVAAGAVYVLCWGPDAVRCEDIVDEAIVHTAMAGIPRAVMTTAHNGESLLEAFEFATTVAVPADDYQDSCKTVLVVIADNVHWYNEAQNCLEDLLNHDAA